LKHTHLPCAVPMKVSFSFIWVLIGLLCVYFHFHPKSAGSGDSLFMDKKYFRCEETHKWVFSSKMGIPTTCYFLTSFNLISDGFPQFWGGNPPASFIPDILNFAYYDTFCSISHLALLVLDNFSPVNDNLTSR
jgi:hypothetical protein